LSGRPVWNHKSGQEDDHNGEPLENLRVASELEGNNEEKKQKNEWAQKN